MPILLIVIAVVVALSTRSFTAGSRSMLPTLTQGEFFLAFKWYPTLAQGDIVVFNRPNDPNTAYVHRLIGKPGDRIQMINGLLHINGQPVKRARIDDYDYEGASVKQWRETLPNGVIHRTIDVIENGFYDNTPVYVVPEGHYFTMGDNRDVASDSRIKSRTVPRENLIGVVFYCKRGCK